MDITIHKLRAPLGGATDSRSGVVERPPGLTGFVIECSTRLDTGVFPHGLQSQLGMKVRTRVAAVLAVTAGIVCRMSGQQALEGGNAARNAFPVFAQVRTRFDRTNIAPGSGLLPSRFIVGVHRGSNFCALIA
jgi:hypothetical protein